MAEGGKNSIPVKAGLWTTPATSGEEPRLIGSKCPSCGELFFPKKEQGWCVHCQKRGLKDVRLSSKGRIGSFSVVMLQPGGGFYKGPVPYAYGSVDLVDGVRVKSLFTGCDLDKLEVGMEVELVIEKLCDDDDGNEIMTFKFKPARE